MSSSTMGSFPFLRLVLEEEAMITWLVESCEVRRSMKNVGEFDVSLEQKEIETELAMTRNDEEKFKWLEFKGWDAIRLMEIKGMHVRMNEDKVCSFPCLCRDHSQGVADFFFEACDGILSTCYAFLCLVFFFEDSLTS
ncbi:uncharacterized protein DS421_16g543330 [Arachis hypogaea]|nr:uncharacterized protein DS421_16g543330 [Arachis hypogaea]